MKRLFITVIFYAITFFSKGQHPSDGFQIVQQDEKKQIDVLFNGKLLTAYCYFDSIKKPFLFPLNTVDGITVTRGYPIRPMPGERTDHPHHTGMWMNYESVNGLDFWNNSTAIVTEKRNMYGTIRHDKVLDKKAEKNKASFTVSATWHQPDDKILLQESTTYIFSVKENNFFIDRISTLKATNQEVVFKDVKDGFLAIRVARELEMPSQQEDVFIDVHGNKTTVPLINNEGVSGMYYNSNGVKGDSVWSTKARWAMLKGVKENNQITIGIFDHPSNPGYPTYWHARGYGLFALNPLGRKIFSKGNEELNFSLKPDSSVTFHYKVLIASGTEISAKEMNAMADDFGKTK